LDVFRASSAAQMAVVLPRHVLSQPTRWREMKILTPRPLKAESGQLGGTRSQAAVRIPLTKGGIAVT
jgi:hypothetical protein